MRRSFVVTLLLLSALVGVVIPACSEKNVVRTEDPDAVIEDIVGLYSGTVYTFVGDTVSLLLDAHRTDGQIQGTGVRYSTQSSDASVARWLNLGVVEEAWVIQPVAPGTATLTATVSSHPTTTPAPTYRLTVVVGAGPKDIVIAPETIFLTPGSTATASVAMRARSGQWPSTVAGTFACPDASAAWVGARSTDPTTGVTRCNGGLYSKDTTLVVNADPSPASVGKTSRIIAQISSMEHYAPALRPDKAADTLYVTVVEPISRLEFRAPGAATPGLVELFAMQSAEFPAVALNAAGGVVAAFTGIRYQLANANDANELTVDPQTGRVTATSLNVASKDVGVVATGTLNGQSITAQGTVRVRTRVSGIAVAPAPGSGETYELVDGTTTQLAAIATYHAGAPTTPAAPVGFSTADQNVARVDAQGRLEAVAPGTTTLVMRAEGFQRVANVLVRDLSAPTPVPTSLEIRIFEADTTRPPDDEVLFPSGITQLRAVVRDQNGTVMPNEGVTWISSDAARAQVTQSGEVRAVAPGTVTITATSVTDQSLRQSVVITVRSMPVVGPPAQLVIDPASRTTSPGTVVRYQARLLDAHGNETSPEPGFRIVYAVAHSAVAENDGGDVESGRIRAKAAGTTTVTAYYTPVSGGAPTFSAPAALHVASPSGAFSVHVTPSHQLLSPGVSTFFTAEVRDAQGAVVPGAAVRWHSSNATSVPISPTTGGFSANHEGGAVITAEVVLPGGETGPVGYGYVTVRGAGAIVANVGIAQGAGSVAASGATARAYQDGVPKGEGYVPASSASPGRLYIPGLAPGSYTVMVSLPGHLARTFEGVVVTASAITTLNPSGIDVPIVLEAAAARVRSAAARAGAARGTRAPSSPRATTRDGRAPRVRGAGPAPRASASRLP